MKRIVTVCVGLFLLQGCGDDGSDGPEPTRILPTAVSALPGTTPAPVPPDDDPIPTTVEPPPPEMQPTGEPPAPEPEPPPEPAPGSEPEPEPEPEPTAAGGVPERFVGVWQSDCRRIGDLAGRQLLFLEADRQESGSLVYLDEDCGTAQLETRLSSDFAFGATRTLADGSEVTEVDVTTGGDIRTIPLTDLVAVQLSLERTCGIDDWEVGVEYDTSDCAEVSASIQPLVGRTVEQIYSVQGDDLLVGTFAPTPASPVPTTRPTELDFLNPLRRVAP